MRDAAALLHDGVTALGLMERVGVKAGDWVLVTAAGGGMGLLLVQLARAAGGRVVAAARGTRKPADFRRLRRYNRSSDRPFRWNGRRTRTQPWKASA